MYFAKKRFIGKLIGVATAIFLVLSMMPGLAWGAEATDGSLPQEVTTSSLTVENPHTATTDAAATTLPADSSAGTDSSLQTAATPSAQVSSNTSSTSATTLDTGSSSAKDAVSITTLDSRDQQLLEQAQIRTLATTSIKKEVSVDGVIYYDGEVNDPQIPDKIAEIGPSGVLYYRLSFDDQTGPLVGLQITDVLDDGFEYIATTAEVNGTKKEPTITGQELKWTDLDIGVGQALTYRVFASKTASTGEPPNPYENTATGDEPASTATHPTLGTDTAKVVVTNTDLRIDKKISLDGTSYGDGPITVGPGDTVYFRVILTNNGATPFDPDSLVLADDLPEGFSIVQDPANKTTPTINGEFQVADAGGGSAGAVETWTISKSLGAEGSEDIKPADGAITSYGDTVTLDFWATASSVPSLIPYVNLSQIIKTAGDHPVYFASDTAEVSVGASLTKQVSVGGSAFANEAKVKQGEQVTYKIVVTNPGDADITDVGIMDALPTNFEYVAGSTEITDSDGVTTKDSATTDTDPDLADYNADPSILDRVLSWPKEGGTSFTVVAGKTLTIAYKVTATNAISSIPYENGAVALQGVSTEQAEMFASGSSKVTVLLKEVKKQVSTDGTTFSDEVSIAVNTLVYYRITITNADASDVTVSVEDTLPTGFTYQNGTTIGATTNNPAINGQKLTWSPITATKNADTTLTFQAKAGSTIGDSNVNTVRALQNTGELGSDTANVKVTGTPTITIAKSVDRSTATPNETLTYTITYSNTGTVALTNVVITDVVPTGATFVSGSASDGGVFDQNTSTITWTVGNVAAGTSKSVSFKAVVNANATGTITNTASIDSNETDAKTASATTNVVVVLQTTTTQQPATLPQSENPTSTQIAAQQLPTTLPKTGLDLLGYLFGAVALVSSGLFLRRMGRDKR